MLVCPQHKYSSCLPQKNRVENSRARYQVLLHSETAVYLFISEMASQENQDRFVKKKLSYSLPSPGLFDLERGPDPGNLSPSFTRGSDDVPGSGASDKPLSPGNGSHGHGVGHRISSVLHRTFTQQFRAADSGEKQSGFRNLFRSGNQAGRHWKNR